MKTKTEFKTQLCGQFKNLQAKLVGMLFLCLAALTGPAQTHTVTNCTEAALRAAMADGGTITFACDGTITLTNTITNQWNTVLDSSGHNITISGGNAVRVLYNSTNASLTLINVTIANGSSINGAGIFNDGGQVTLSQAVFQDNIASNLSSSNAPQGGGIFNAGGMVNATNCSFVGNAAAAGSIIFQSSERTSCGGAILNAGGELNLGNCVFMGNSVSGSIGIGEPDYMFVSGADGTGGAINNSGILNADGCTFVQNSASGGRGGEVYISAPWPGSDGGEGSGGAVFNSGTATIKGGTFSGNSAIGGSGGDGGNGTWVPWGYDATPGASGGSGGAGNGGAICNSGLMTVEGSVVVSNSCAGGTGGAGGGAGGWYGEWGQRYPTEPAGYPGTGGGGNGGALSGTAELMNDTLAFNTGSGGRSGDLYNGNDGSGSGGICGPVQMTNCTVAFNSGFVGDGGKSASATGGLTSGSLLVNSILASNAPSNCSGTIVDAGHNLSSDNSCAFTSAGSFNNTDPMLGPLADNGGPTLTMALLLGSPAIDAGDDAAAPPTDQRGFPRPFGVASDIGAYEYTPLTWGASLQSQTAESGSSVEFIPDIEGYPAMTYLLFSDDTNLICCSTDGCFMLTNVDFSASGSYTIVVTNAYGAVTSAPVMLNVIPSVERRPVPSVTVTGEAGSSLGLDYCDTLGPTENWKIMATMTLSSNSQYYCDAATPLPPQRFYRAWQAGSPGVIPSLNLNFVPAITLTGSVGKQLHLDCINQFGPTDAWVTLDTVTLTNTSQLYFDTSAVGQPQRLYRIMPVP